jgi:hypothetical protein
MTLFTFFVSLLKTKLVTKGEEVYSVKFCQEEPVKPGHQLGQKTGLDIAQF